MAALAHKLFHCLDLSGENGVLFTALHEVDPANMVGYVPGAGITPELAILAGFEDHAMGSS
jgi:hypothetical protein